MPKDQDTPIGLHFGGDYTTKYRALVFVNGWNLGQYVNDVGPQRTFYLPQGILRHQGTNRISLAVWSDDGAGLGPVSLTSYGNHLTSQRIGDVASPAYDATKYAEPADTSLSLDGPVGGRRRRLVHRHRAARRAGGRADRVRARPTTSRRRTAGPSRRRGRGPGRSPHPRRAARRPRRRPGWWRPRTTARTGPTGS